MRYHPPEVQSVSFSVGSGAVLEVREAVAHAAQHPSHNPIVYLHWGDRGQQVQWSCKDCADDES